jgi:DNA-binding SARP family transcriptional activator
MKCAVMCPGHLCRYHGVSVWLAWGSKDYSPNGVVTDPVTMTLQFRLLGRLEARHGGMVVMPLLPGKRRAVLAALRGDVGRLGELTVALWGQRPPPSARMTVQNYVRRLRQALGDSGRSRISAQPRGYVNRVDAGKPDATLFEEFLGDAQTAARGGLWDAAAGRPRKALALWQGEPLADVDSEMLAAREVLRLAELRLQAQESRIDADLHRVRHADVVTELRQLIGADPLGERLHGQLMLAVHRAGRQAAVLAAYQQAPQALVEELGIEPGTGLWELHQQILIADPVLAKARARRPAVATGPVAPRPPPAGVPHCTGQADELAALTGLLDRCGEQTPGAIAISMTGGTAGVGKTALAVRAHSQDIPAEEDERAARYRSLWAPRLDLVQLIPRAAAAGGSQASGPPSSTPSTTRRRIVRETKTARYLRGSGIRWWNSRGYLSGDGIDVKAGYIDRASHIG